MNIRGLFMRNFILAICFLAFSSGVNAQHPSLGGGSGSSSNPFLISDTSHLRILADFVNAGNGNATNSVYYKLMNDLDLNVYANWNPIGNDIGVTFQGNFNGNGKVIQNLTINQPTTNYIGLFGHTSGATIQNLGVENCNISGNSFVGGLVGNNTNASVIACYTTGNVNGSDTVVGGLVGININSSIISCCYAKTDVSGTKIIGGLVGSNNAVIQNCYAAGDVNGDDKIGGIIGMPGNSSVIRNCVAANNALTITTNSQTINRIAGTTKPGAFHNNYALDNMMLLAGGSIRPINDNLNGAPGMGKPITGFYDLKFYTNVSNWNIEAWSIDSTTAIWKICNGIDLPFLRWQGIICSPKTITAIAGANGSINPSGVIIIEEGEDQTFTFTADNGYKIDEVLIDGTNNSAVVTTGLYTFENVTDNHTIEVSFKDIPVITHTIMASAGTGGSISPSGNISVSQGENKTFTFTANSGYAIDQVLINDTNNPTAATAGSYTFTNVTANHKIEVSFKTTVGIVGANKILPIQIYPNPTTGQLIIDNGQLTIKNVEIYDIVGKLVQRSPMSALSPETTIDISHLASGMYFFKIDGKVFKIVKQ